jgi:hypothetical protein
MRHAVAATVAAGMTAVLFTACSSLTSSTSPSSAPTATDGALVAQGVQTSVESSIASFLGGVQPPTQSFSTTSPGTIPYLRLSHVPADLAHGAYLGLPGSRTRRAHAVVTTRDNGPPSCVTVVPNPTVDTDGDGIPDTVSMTAGPNCSFTNDSLTFSVSGSLVEGDPTPSVPDADYMATLNHFTIGVNSGGDSATIAMNGTATVTETTGSLSQANQLTLAIMSTGADTVNTSFAQNWMATFTFTGQQLTANTGLPAGTLGFTGTTDYTGNGKSFALAISTPTPLTFDPTCTTNSQITAGTVQATFSGTNGAAYVTLVWSGCQEPTTTFVAPQ